MASRNTRLLLTRRDSTCFLITPLAPLAVVLLSGWDETPHIQQWMAEKNFTDVDTYGYFLQQAHELAFANGREVINWVEAFQRLGAKLDKRVIVHVWKGRGELNEVLNAGYRALLR